MVRWKIYDFFGPSCICTCVVWCCVGGRQLPRMLQALTSVARLSFSMTFLSRDGPRLIVHTNRPPLSTRHWTGSLGHRVNGSSGSSFTSGSAGHRAIILTRCETEFFPFSKKCPKCKTYIWNAEMTKGVCCWTQITGYQSMQWTFTFTYDY